MPKKPHVKCGKKMGRLPASPVARLSADLPHRWQRVRAAHLRMALSAAGLRTVRASR
jgi:hypothetical protein